MNKRSHWATAALTLSLAACSARSGSTRGSGGGSDAGEDSGAMMGDDTPTAADQPQPGEDLGAPPADVVAPADTGNAVDAGNPVDTGNGVDVVIAPVDTGPSCAMGETVCQGQCVNLASSLGNCGACGRACAAGQLCSAGNCQTSCPSPNQLCNGACVATVRDPAHCGACGNVCRVSNGTAACVNSACTVASCATGFGDCDMSASNGCETNLSSTPTSCGACGRTCTAPGGGSVTCVNGACVGACPNSGAVCNGVCVTLDANVEHCGACNNRCPSGQSCIGGACRAGADPGELRIESLGSTACQVLPHENVTGDDNGPIALSSTHLFYSGDTALGLFDTATFVSATSVPAVYQALLHDVSRGTVYAPAVSATTPMPLSGGILTHLIELDGATAVRTGRVVTLSQPILVGSNPSSGSLGLFSGAGRALVWAGGRIYDIDYATGAVTPRSNLAQPGWYQCESPGVYGVAESFGGQLYITYRAASFNGNLNTIVRQNIAGGTPTAVTTFSNLGDLCGFTVSPARQRWYFHHEGSSQFASNSSAEFVGQCPANITPGSTPVMPGGLTFRIESLAATGCQSVSNATVVNDDRGGIAVTASLVLDNGDLSAARHNLDSLGSVASVGRILDGLFSDLATETAYVFGVNANTPVSGSSLNGTSVSHIIPLGATTGVPNTAGAIALSRSLTFTGSETSTTRVGIYSGRGRVLVTTLGRVYDVALPSGAVTDLGAMTPPATLACESFATWGVAEYFNNTHYIVYRAAAGNVIMRARVPDALTQTVGSFSNLSDMCSFTVSPSRSRWLMHHTGATQFTTQSGEIVSSCPLVLSMP